MLFDPFRTQLWEEVQRFCPVREKKNPFDFHAIILYLLQMHQPIFGTFSLLLLSALDLPLLQTIYHQINSHPISVEI